MTEKVDQTLDPSNWLKSIEKAVPECTVSDLSTIKCHLCYSTEVIAICQQCKQFVCQRCQSLDQMGDFYSYLFSYLVPLLPQKLQHPVYCSACFPKLLTFTLMLRVVSLLLVMSALVSLLLPGGRLLSSALGAGAIVIEIGREIIRYWGVRSVVRGKDFPLLCKIIVNIEEAIVANFMITGSDYLDLSSPALGSFKIKLYVRPNDLERYKTALLIDRTDQDQQIMFQAGFVAVENLQKIEQKEDLLLNYYANKLAKNLLCLNKAMTLQEFEQLKRAPYLCELISQDYNINIHKALQLDPPHNKSFSIQVVPYLFKSGRRLEIKIELLTELKLNYLKRTGDEKPPGLAGKPMLEKLTVKPLTNWTVEGTDGYYDRTKEEIRWRNKKFDLNAPLSFFIEFHTSEGNLQDTTELLSGEYKIVIEDWSASQLHIARDVTIKEQSMIHGASGMSLNTADQDLKWVAPVIKHQTTIQGALTWDMRHISAQKVQSIPDLFEGTHSQDPQIDRQRKAGDQEKLLVAPSYHVINEVIEALTTSKIFVKQVIESPGYLTENDWGGKQMLYWEIKGRYYRRNSLQPIVLHLVISGEAPRSDQPNCQGVLTFEMNLRSHAPLIENNRTYIDLRSDYEDFKKMIRYAAYRGRRIDYKGRRITAWQKESQFEKEMAERLSVKNVAVILPSHSPGKVGHLFLQSSECSHDSIQSKHTDWEIHQVDPLPQVVTPTINWIDKWNLLEILEDREREYAE